MLTNHLPTSMTQWLRFADTRSPLRGQRRVWFSRATKTRTGFPFHSPQFSADAKTPAKHLTTSTVMLTAAQANGKLQTPVDLLGRLIDYDQTVSPERLLIHEGLVDSWVRFRRG